MELRFEFVSNKDDSRMRDVLHLLNDRTRADFGHEGNLVGVNFNSGQFFVVAYEKGKPVGLMECERSQAGSSRKQIKIYEFVTLLARRKNGVAERLLRYMNHWAARNGYPRVIIPLANPPIQRLAVRMKEVLAHRRISAAQRKRLQGMSLTGNRVVFRLRPITPKRAR